MTTSETPSQPDSLLADLDYDDWEGLFEFVGPINQTGDDQDNIDFNGASSSDEDLNLSVYVPSNQPILIDEETFLSLQPSDFESETEPQSGYFIENALHDINIDTIKNNKDTFNNKFAAAKFNNNSLKNNLSAEEITNIKNKLISDGYDLNGLKLNNNNMNGFTADLCDNLTEQVNIVGLIT